MALQAAGRPLVLLDCGFDLGDPKAGQRAYAASHLPGAHYAHLDRDLSGPKDGRNGRHPLPTREAMSQQAGRLGRAPRRASGGLRRPWPALCRTGLVAAALAGASRGGRAGRRTRCLAGGRRNTEHQRPAIGAGPPLPGVGRTRHARHHGTGTAGAPGQRAGWLAEAAGCPRRRTLSRRSRTAGPGCRPHPWRHAALFQGQPGRRRTLQTRRSVAQGLRGPGRHGVPTAFSSAVRASPPVTTCWRWRMPAWASAVSLPAVGASGAATHRDRWPAADAAR
jgi:hypothetical protein